MDGTRRRLTCARCRLVVDERSRCNICNRLACRDCMPGRYACLDCRPGKPAPPLNRPLPWHDAKLFVHGRVAYGALTRYVKTGRYSGYMELRPHPESPRRPAGRRRGRSGAAADEAYHGPNYGEEGR